MTNCYNLGLLFEETVINNYESIALSLMESCISYGELSVLVNQLAQLLISRNLKKGDRIAIINTKGYLSYVLMLAALKLGVAYINLDGDVPVERNNKIIELCIPKIIFYDDFKYENVILKLINDKCEYLYLDLDMINHQKTNNNDLILEHLNLVDGSTIAYIMFTSGSTGTPKGVAITHQNVLHFICWAQKQFNISNNDNFANLSPMYFDNSVFDFYAGLFSGACLTPIPKSLLANPAELITFISHKNCTIWFSVPSLLIYLFTMKVMNYQSLPFLKHIIFGGEGYPKIELKKLFDEFSNRAILTNVYGPTECTCICSAHKISQIDFESLDGLPSLGKLNQNFDFRILDENGKDSNEGVLCLIGPNVGAGYFNDLERTLEAFVFLTEPTFFMKRMYLTGDIVKNINGNLFFVGRKDNQIKHMGYRIELEEIEFALLKIQCVYQAAVIYQRVSTSYGKIIAYVAVEKELDDKYIIQNLINFLPNYMIPSKIFTMKDLPKNANGKVDKNKLKELNLFENNCST